MAVVGEMHYLTIGNNTYSIPVSGGGGGTVTSVRVQATSPVQSSVSGEQTISLNTTISLADGYGDTKNPYGTKTANYVLAGPTSGSAAAPTFRALTVADIPDLSSSYLPSSTTIPSKTSDLTNDAGFITSANIPSLLSGTTANITPTQVANALANNQNVEITHTDSTYGTYKFYDFIHYTTANVVIASAVATMSNQWIVLELSGRLNDNVWVVFGSTLAEESDIPTIPTNVSTFTNDAGYLTSEVNSNWVNGSQTGSVRTINSQVENSNYTIGQYAVAEGSGTKASGMMSHAEGGGTVASGQSAHAEGASTIASGVMSHAEGGGATASGNYSHAEGQGSTANGQFSHAEGGNTTASGTSSHAEGGGTTASGEYSHAEGNSTIANHRSQHVFGEWNITDSSSNAATERGNYVEIVGNGTSSTRSSARTLDWLGNEVLAGKLTIGTNPTAAMDVVTKQYMENQGYLTSYTETDPTVPSWAKASTKPSYSASEISGLLDFFYPVGSYYQTSDSTFNPNTDWGGRWTLLGEGQVLISAGTNYTAGQSYGSNTETLSDNQLMHTHGFTNPTYKATGAAVNDHAATACTRTTNAAVTESGAHSHSITALHYVSGVTDLKPPSGSNWKQESISTGSSGAHTHTMTQPAFSTPKLTHTVTQPTITVNTNGSVTKIGTVNTRSSYSTMQASTAAYIWHRTA